MMRSRLSTTFGALALVTGALAAPWKVAPRQDESPFATTAIANFTEPWALAFLPDDRVLVTEKGGTLNLVNPDDGTKSEVSGVPTVAYGGQGGLGDVVLHPDFASNSLLYFSYAEPGDDDTEERGAVVARAKLALGGSDNATASLEDPEVVWRQVPKDPSTGHFSHRILFGGDNNTLWISSGDRQLFDPAQDMESNMGKILRLNDDGSIPEGNPFADQGGVAAQVWALGVRNPLGFDLDAEGNLWEIEMGPQGGDEFNLIEKAGNYGWPLVSEGDHYDDEPIPNHDTRPEFIPPLIAWTPVINPSSLIVYKGDLFPEWKGNAFVSGMGHLGLVRVEMSGDTAEEAERIPLGRRTRCVRQHSDGTLWTLEDGQDARLLRHAPS